MLRELRIRNFAVVDAVEVELEPGFNVLTGETGAGKSLLIDAILLVRGGRAQTDLIRKDAEVATVEAVFEVGERSAAASVLDEAGLDTGDGRIVVRREVARAGRHRAFVNDGAVTLGLLERLGDQLVEVHGQHEHQRLLAPAHQLALLDRFAGVDELRDRVGDLVAKHRQAQAELDRVTAAERDRAQREDLLRFQVSELDAARIRPGEEEELRVEQRRARNLERLVRGLDEVTALLVDDPESVTGRLGRAVSVLTGLARVDDAFGAPAEPLTVAGAHLEDAVQALRALRDGLAVEPGRLEAIGERLDALMRLRRKYGDTEDAMLAFREDAATELERLARHEEIRADQERLVKDLAAEVATEAAVLSERRVAAARRLAAATERELRLLGMERVLFEIAIERADVEHISTTGLDRVELRLTANPGEAPKALSRIASGGELSRTMLAIQNVLSAADPVPTMVFDEVDAGIGARVAQAVADTLAKVAASRQVLCVTHLAPIAARARHHVRVAKTVRGGRTRVSAVALSPAERVQEIARMLGGDSTSETALRHARELLKRS